MVRFSVHGNYFSPYAARSSKTLPLNVSVQLELLGVACAECAMVGSKHEAHYCRFRVTAESPAAQVTTPLAGALALYYNML